MKASQGQNPLSNHFLTVRALPLSLEFPAFPIPTGICGLTDTGRRRKARDNLRAAGSYLKFVPQQLVHNLLFFICCLVAELGEDLDPPLLVFSLTKESSRGIAPTPLSSPAQGEGRLSEEMLRKPGQGNRALGIHPQWDNKTTHHTCLMVATILAISMMLEVSGG